jgi:hypothetical protein
MRLDEDKLEALRNWGERLREAGGKESTAVGRAILMLVEEIDQLQRELWYARLQEETSTPSTEETHDYEDEPISPSLHHRLLRSLRRHPDVMTLGPSDQPETDVETDTTSARSWIEDLRHPK